MNVEGVLTYQDVTNIDSIGIVTARSDIRGGRNLNVTGISTFTGAINGSSATFSGHLRSTGTDGVSIDTAGYAYLNFQTDRTGASDNIGGPLFKNASGTVVSRIQSFVDGQINIRTGSGNAPDYAFVAKPDGAVELYHNGTKQFETGSSGVLLPDMSTNKGRLAFGDFGTRIEGGAGAGADDGIHFMTNSVASCLLYTSPSPRD